MVTCAARAGFTHVGLRLIPATPEEVSYETVGDTPVIRDVRARLDDTGVAVLDIEILRLNPETRVADFLPVLETGARLGARNALVAGNDPVEVRLTERFGDVCDLAAPLGIAPCLEPMPWTDVRDFAQGARILRAADRANAGILIDAIHFDRGGSAPDQIEGVPREWFRYMQLCDAPAARPANTRGPPVPGARRAPDSRRRRTRSRGSASGAAARLADRPRDSAWPRSRGPLTRWNARAGCASPPRRCWPRCSAGPFELPARISAAALCGRARIRPMSNLPAPATMYRAFVRHDPSYEGVFWLGVRTTGIFCRPTCRARTPKRENVEFFGAPVRRAARRLPAMHEVPSARPRPQAAAARRRSCWSRSSASPVRRYRDAELAGLGIDPSTARRQFKRYCGMTFQAYHRARRMGLALARHQERKDRDRLATGPGLRIRQRIPRGVRAHRRHRAVARRRRRRAARADGWKRRWARCSRWPTTAVCICSISSTGAVSSARSRCCRSACTRACCRASIRYLAQIERELAEYFARHAACASTRRWCSPARRSRRRVWKRAAGDSRGRDVIVRASSPRRSASRRRCARSAAPTATTGSRSSCRATASSAPTAR